MQCLIEPLDLTGRERQELAEEQFLEQFAAIEEGLGLLQIQMRRMSDSARRFGSLAERIRRSTCGAKVERQ